MPSYAFPGVFLQYTETEKCAASSGTMLSPEVSSFEECGSVCAKRKAVYVQYWRMFNIYNCNCLMKCILVNAADANVQHYKFITGLIIFLCYQSKCNR